MYVSLTFLLDDLDLCVQQILYDVWGEWQILLGNTVKTLLASLKNSTKQTSLKKAYRLHRCRPLRGEVEETRLLYWKFWTSEHFKKVEYPTHKLFQSLLNEHFHSERAVMSKITWNSFTSPVFYCASELAVFVWNCECSMASDF